MFSKKYELEIINKDNNNLYKKYKLNNENYIGIYENESFLIRFKNKTNKMIQIKISIDNINVLTNKLINDKPIDEESYIIHPWEELEVKNWLNRTEFLFNNTSSNLGSIMISIFEESQNKINYFNKTKLQVPKLTENLNIKYECWTSLRSNLRKKYSKLKRNVDIKNRVQKNKRKLKPEDKYIEYQRFMKGIYESQT